MGGEAECDIVGVGVGACPGWETWGQKPGEEVRVGKDTGGGGHTMTILQTFDAKNFSNLLTSTSCRVA